MKDVTPKREREAWRGTVKITRPWADIVKYWAEFTNDMPKLEPLHQLVQALATSPASSVLFASISWHGIVVSDSPDFRSTDGALEIDFLVGGGHFEFRHRTFSGNNDRKMCPASEGIETLRLFLKYKYGVLLEGPVTES